MSYVEWLRVRNCLRIIAIVLGVLILGMLIMRVVFHNEIDADTELIKHVQLSAGSTTTHTVLPNGTRRTTINDPSERTVVTLDSTGPGIERTITITEPSSRPARREHVSFGSVDVHDSIANGMRTTVINTNNAVPLWTYMLVGFIVSLIVATVLGAPFARESDGHLEIAMTRPQPRYIIAARTIGVDLAGIWLSMLMTVVALIIVQALFEIPHFAVIDQASFQIMGIVVVGPAAWYAFLSAATSWMNRGYGVIQGLSWLIAGLVVLFGVMTWPDNMLGNVMHGIFMPLSYLDPLRYMSTHMQLDEQTGAMSVDPDTYKNVAIEGLLFVAYSALAVFQWQKVEA